MQARGFALRRDATGKLSSAQAQACPVGHLGGEEGVSLAVRLPHHLAGVDGQPGLGLVAHPRNGLGVVLPRGEFGASHLFGRVVFLDGRVPAG